MKSGHDSAPVDDFGSLLPVLLSKPSTPLPDEPALQSLHGKRTKRRLRSLGTRMEQLHEAGRVASGDRLLMLVSDIGLEYRPSVEEGGEHMEAAEGLRRTLTGLFVPEHKINIAPMSRQAYYEALMDPSIGHMLYIGHSNRSRISDENGQSLNWFEHPELDHLKRSFGVLGCATVTDDKFYPRNGSTFVSPEGIIYGVEGDYLDVGQPYSFDQLVPKPPTRLKPEERVDTTTQTKAA